MYLKIPIGKTIGGGGVLEPDTDLKVGGFVMGYGIYPVENEHLGGFLGNIKGKCKIW